jgi:hypothetical protein
MGKKTKIHPLPLTVIRGAAEYCGFKFGAIKQTSLFDDNTQARYIADVEVIPLKLKNKTDVEILAYLADCFAISITPAWPRRNKAGLLKVDLLIDSKNRSKPSISNGGGGGGGEYDGWDGLKLCSVCGDRETRNDVCWSCRQQEQIDRSGLDPLLYECRKCHEFKSRLPRALCLDCWKKEK